MFHNFGFEVSEVLEQAENERLHLKHPYVGSEHLLLAILKSETKLSKKLKDLGLTYTSFKSELVSIVGNASKMQDLILYTPLLKRIIENAMEDASENNQGVVTLEHLFLAMLEEGEGIAIRIMLSMDIDLESLYDDLKVHKIISKERDNLEIYKLGIVLNDTISMEESVVGRENELDLMIETLLRKKKNNPLLIGKAGVGKTALVEELVRKIKRGEVPEDLEGKEILLLEMGSLVAGTKYRGEFEERLTKLIKEVIENKNIIIFIDEIHSMVNAGGAEGAINASDILKPYLARGDLKVIGATTTEEYYKFISKDKALERRFEKIILEEPNTEETISILNAVKKEYETHHGVCITEENIKEIVTLANDYIFDKNNPDKSLELLDSLCANIKAKEKIVPKSNSNDLKKLQKQKEKYILEGNYEKAISLKKEEERLKKADCKQKIIQKEISSDNIREMVEKKTGIPIRQNEQETWDLIKERLQKKIFGQESAIEKIYQTLKNTNMNRRKPISFLLLGATGVGKTETVKQFAEVFGKKDSLIRLDMSEYNLETSIHKLIGTPGGYVGYGESFIFQKLKENPYRVILVDELEKASPKIWNLFLQILDEGFITDSVGEKIRFDKSIIFMTSNIEQKEKVGFTKSLGSEIDEYLSKEMVGRFNEVISYKKITKEVALKFIESQNLKNIDIDIILKESEYEKYGLRNILHIISKYEKDFQTN